MNNRGAGFFELLAITLIVLKLCGVITFSWWVVLCPLWIPLFISILVLFVLGVIGLIKYINVR